MKYLKSGTIIAALFAGAGAFSQELPIPLGGDSTGYQTCQTDWLKKSDADFARDCADVALGGSGEAAYQTRQIIAWMLFARVSQMIDDQQGVSLTGKVPAWMAWPTDADTFRSKDPFVFHETPVNRSSISPVLPKSVLAGAVGLADPDGANEEVTRNQISYDYLTQSNLTTLAGVTDYLTKNQRVEMPVGSVEIKASWLKVSNGGVPPGAITFNFDGGIYWYRGMHIMVKMQNLPAGENPLYSETPSWFWTTFEFNNNIGTQRVREAFITQRAPLPIASIEAILRMSDIDGYGFDQYAPNGTQVRFTQDGTGKGEIILGHTDMEDFAGWPNIAQPNTFQSFNASCHTCHATAAFNPETGKFFPFSVPTGAMFPQYYAPDHDGKNVYLGAGFKSLDFMWPISFQIPKSK